MHGEDIWCYAYCSHSCVLTILYNRFLNSTGVAAPTNVNPDQLNGIACSAAWPQQEPRAMPSCAVVNPFSMESVNVTALKITPAPSTSMYCHAGTTLALWGKGKRLRRNDAVYPVMENEPVLSQYWPFLYPLAHSRCD